MCFRPYFLSPLGQGESSLLNTSKIVCVAKNYTNSVSEKQNSLEIKERNASIFIKPPSALCSIYDKVAIGDRTDVVCETELALLISTRLSLGTTNVKDIIGSIGGVAVAFDLTKKDMQTELKNNGKPWELSKGFDRACPISEFIKIDANLESLMRPNVAVTLSVNGETVLSQNLTDMILSPIELIRLISKHFTLCPGDIILTGTPTTPKEPPRLCSGDVLDASLTEHLSCQTLVQ